MKDWFDTLNQRERLIVAVGAVVVVAAIFFALVWQPLAKGHAARVASIEIWEQALTQLRPLKNIQQQPGQQKSLPTNGQQTPVVIIDQTLRARGLDRSLKRSQPTTSSGIRVEFENVAFDDMVLWLGDLSTQYSMHVQSGSLSVASLAGPGRINATLTLERSL